MRYSATSITVYYWRVSLCPRSIHPMVVLLYSFASVVVGNFLLMKSIVAIAVWLMRHFNQTVPLLRRPGEVLHHRHLLAQANLEENHGYSPQLNPHRIAPLTVFRYLNRHSAHPINIRRELLYPPELLANNLAQTTFMGPQYNNSSIMLNPPNSHQQVDFNQAI